MKTVKLSSFELTLNLRVLLNITKPSKSGELLRENLLNDTYRDWVTNI